MGGCMIMSKPWYQSGYRRMLVDMHIVDWEEEFLSKYDPEFMAEMYSRANLTSAMFYCQSHVGLCYWPTKSGKMHAGLKGRDIVGELHEALKSRGIVSVAYYSLIFNNWAFLEHPEWRIVPASGPFEEGKSSSRYGLCCPNNPGYRDFVTNQITELVGGYDFPGIFYDMTFWPNICVCEHCRKRFCTEYGLEIPVVIDWFADDWCKFQSAREKWLAEFGYFANEITLGVRPGISIYHNFAATILGASLAVSFDSAVNHDFLGADFYGDTIEQLMVFKLMLGLSRNRPVEFMTSRCVNLRDHVRLKSYGQMELQAMASTLYSSAFLFIDAINLDGTVNPGIYDRIGRIFQETEPYEQYLGGNPVDDIAVYFSSESKMTFADNGRKIADGMIMSWPHQQAVRGICRLLQEAHLPFGIITRKDLLNLDKYKVIVLPNVLRMTSDEAEMFRQYVERGGRLYASRYTSLTETQGVRLNDFMLADVFGCHFQSDDFGAVSYMKPADKLVSDALAPQDYLSEFDLTPTQNNSSMGILRLSECAEGDVLGTVTLPYGSPHDGSVFDHNWASIHSYPPWEDTSTPALVRHQYGKGMCVYSAGDIECVASEVNDRLFLALLKELTCDDFRWSADAHPCVWVSVTHQPENKRFLIGFLNFQERLPVIPISKAAFRLKVPEGFCVIGVRRILGLESLLYRTTTDGMLEVELANIEKLLMFVVDYM